MIVVFFFNPNLFAQIQNNLTTYLWQNIMKRVYFSLDMRNTNIIVLIIVR